MKHDVIVPLLNMKIMQLIVHKNCEWVCVSSIQVVWDLSADQRRNEMLRAYAATWTIW